MPYKYKSEKKKSGYTEGVAYATGKGGYIKFSGNKAANYSGQARAKAAKGSMRGGY